MATPSDVKGSGPTTTYWVMQDSGTAMQKIIHVTLEGTEAEKVMARVIETEALKALGISAEKLRDAIEAAKGAFTIKKAKTSFED